MSIKGICHINLVISNMDNSINFYRDILGFEVTFDTVLESEALANGAGFNDVTARIVMLKLHENSVILELFQYINPQGETKPINAVNTNGQGHFAIEVTNIDEVYNSLKAKGVSFLSEPQKVSDGVKFCYFRDPDGALIEIIEFN